jgi:hypothetical protein
MAARTDPRLKAGDDQGSNGRTMPLPAILTLIGSGPRQPGRTSDCEYQSLDPRYRDQFGNSFSNNAPSCT